MSRAQNITWNHDSLCNNHLLNKKKSLHRDRINDYFHELWNGHVHDLPHCGLQHARLEDNLD